MPWYRIRTGSKVYVLDPEHLHLTGEDGHLLKPDEILAGWRRVGAVDRLPDGCDVEAAARGEEV